MGRHLGATPQWLHGWVKVLLVLLQLTCVLNARPSQPLPDRRCAQIESLPAGQSEVDLVLGVPVERSIHVGEVHAYRLVLTPGEYLQAIIEQRAIDVLATIIGPDKREYRGSDTLYGAYDIRGPDYICVVADVPGVYRLEVRGQGNEVGRASYRLMIEERRLAVPQDRIRLDAQRAFAEATAIPKDWVKEQGEPIRVAEQRVIAKYEEALALWNIAGDRRMEAETRFHLAWEFYNFEEFHEAMESWEQALPLWRAVGDRRGEGDTLERLGWVHMIFGEYPRVIELTNQALVIARARGDRLEEMPLLDNLCGAYRFMDDYEKALEYLEEQLAISRGLGNRLWEALCTANLGRIHQLLGEYPEATEFIGQAVTLSRNLGNSELETRMTLHLARAYTSAGRYKEALHAYSRSLEIYRNIRGGLFEAQALEGIGSVYAMRGEPRRALIQYDEALQLCRKMGYRSLEARVIGEIGGAYLAIGQSQKALDHYRDAVPRCQEFGFRVEEATNRYGIARIEFTRGNLLRARGELETSLGLVESVRTNVPSTELRTAYLATTREIFELYMELLFRLHQREPAAGYDTALLQACERARARGLLDLLAEARIDVQQGVDPHLKQQERDMDARISATHTRLMEALSRASPVRGRVVPLQDELNRLSTEREQLEREIRTRHPRYAEIHYPKPFGLAEVQGLLGEQTALLEYALGKERSILIVVDRQHIQTFRLPAAGEISRLVTEVRAGLGQPTRQGFARYRRAASQLERILIRPGYGILATKQNLTIVPDGPLYYLPFEALLAGSGKRQKPNGPARGARPGAGIDTTDYRDFPFLVKRWSITYAPSASVLGSLLQRPTPVQTPEAGSPPKELLAFADPSTTIARIGRQVGPVGPRDLHRGLVVRRARPGSNLTASPVDRLSQAGARRGLMEDGSGWTVQPLRESRREVKGISRQYPAERVAAYFGSAASEENLKTNAYLGTARRIHFATHGLISERRPDYSGLVLAIDADPKEDGLLQVYEIFNLKLSAELVVLSACSTGLGKVVKGEGIIGLTRAFMYAGAPSLVVSLWPVADRSTADLMVSFYRQMNRGESKADGLRRGKLELIGSGRYSHPFYWAPFVLVGARN